LSPDLESGWYLIDPDDDGGAEPFEVYCDMETDDGGWTRVAHEDFEESTSGWSATNTISTCGTYGKILGGYQVISGGSNHKTYGLKGVAHTQARLEIEYVKIDSWDSENATVQFAGSTLYSHTFCFCSQGCQNGGGTCGGEGICGGGWDEEHKIPVSGTVDHTADSVQVYASSSINQDPSDESWGLDNVEVYVR